MFGLQTRRPEHENCRSPRIAPSVGLGVYYARQAPRYRTGGFRWKDLVAVTSHISRAFVDMLCFYGLQRRPECIYSPVTRHIARLACIHIQAVSGSSVLDHKFAPSPNDDFRIGSAFQHRRLGWKSEQTIRCIFSKHFQWFLAQIRCSVQRKTDDHHASRMLFVVFCKPILAILFQKKTSDEHGLRVLVASTVAWWLVVVFCKPIVASATLNSCSPNADFARSNKDLRLCFEVRFKGVSIRFRLRLTESPFKTQTQVVVRSSKICVWGA